MQLAHKDQQAQRVLQARLVHKVQQEPRVPLVHKAQQAQRVQQEI